MGALCSKNFDRDGENDIGNPHPASKSLHSSEIVPIEQGDLTASVMRRSKKKPAQEQNEQLQEKLLSNSQNEISRAGSRKDSDYFYDGIPRVPASLSQKSRSRRTTQAAVGKVSEVSSMLGKAGTAGFGKAVEVLDVLGSSMTDFNSKSGFVSGAASRGTKVSILAFEVANTIVKGSKLISSLSEKHISHLKEVVLPSQGVQKLISKDMDELLRIVSHDKREELEIFSAEVVRFGNRCKDPQWHNLERYFEKEKLELGVHDQPMDEVEMMINQLMNLVQCTSELYHELHSLGRYEQEYHCKQKSEGEDTGLRSELKKQRKLVKNLKKRSLWSRSLEEVIEKLVEVVLFVRLRIHDIFNAEGTHDDGEEQVGVSGCGYQRLGPAGLALHYANMVLQIDGTVARSSSMTPTARDSLYQSLPPSMKSTLRSKLLTFQPNVELVNVQDIKAEMEKTLQWLVPMASNTVKSHHGFGWVGEWANAGSDTNRAPSAHTELVRIDTLYHADKARTESLITDQLVWLHHLIQKSRETGVRATMIQPLKPSAFSTLQRNGDYPRPSDLTTPTSKLSTANQQTAPKRKQSPARSKSEDFDRVKDPPLEKNERLSKSSDQSPSRGDLGVDQPRLSELCTADFAVDRQKPLDSVECI